MLFYISVFIASVMAALVVVYLFNLISGMFQGASSTLISGGKNGQNTYYSRSAKKPVKRARDKSTPWGWGNNTHSAKVAGMYSASSQAASTSSWTTAKSENSDSGSQKAAGFDSFLKNSTISRSSSTKAGPATRTTRKAKGPWGW